MRGMINLLGPLYVRVFRRGASDVLSARRITGATSTTRITIATPTGGKRIRLISCELRSISATTTSLEVYFATGASIATTPGKEISDPTLNLTDMPTIFESWPDGAGPVGAVNDVVSLRTGVNIGASA
ncbi:hypothetical protein LCGC14_3143290, partial [marine sediment metagenome]